MTNKGDNKNDSQVMTIRISPEMRKRLDRLANITKRSRSFHAAEAITGYVTQNEWQIEGIKKAIRSADAGRTVPHAKVKAWLHSLRKGKKLPRPKA